MRISRFVTLSLLLVSLLCFFAASASADQGDKQGPTQLLTAVEDPGNSGPPHNDDGAVGNPSHDDDWSRKDKPNNGAWGSGQHPNGPLSSSDGEYIWTVLAVVTSL